MSSKLFSAISVIALLLASCSENVDKDDVTATFPDSGTNEVVSSSDIVWEQLNPARGDQSPQAGTIWGDRKGEVATGFLAKFVDGFSSPPHIHNVSYRAVVVSGLVHNDDPAAEKMWMPAGSFWTQPAGEAHITAVKGSENIAYVEIDSGPYLVQPIEDAKDNGERPVNIHADNLVWSMKSTQGIEQAFIWGDPLKTDMHGRFMKLPKGFSGVLRTTGSDFRAIVITGRIDYQRSLSEAFQTLDPGSSFSSEGPSRHSLASANGECLIYVRTNGAIEFE